MRAIAVTRRLFPEAESLLRSHFKVTRDLRDAEGILTQLTDRVDGRFMDRAARLRVISQCAVGVDNIDLEEARRRGIVVMNTPGVLTEATADLTWALILAVARRIPEADRICRAQRYRGWDLEFMLGLELHGGTLGIIGPGRIGTAVARRAAGFGMKVVCFTRGRRGRAPRTSWEGVRMKPVSLPRLLAISDVVSLHVPATRQTHHMIGRDQLALMKPTAILVNTARGAAVDERALVEALRAGTIRGAGLDVFESEPRIPAALRRLPSVVLTPHIGSATRHTRGAMAMTAARNLVAWFAGRPDRAHVVSPTSSRRERRPT